MGHQKHSFLHGRIGNDMLKNMPGVSSPRVLVLVIAWSFVPSYGMNVGANTMTLAAREIGMTIIPMGRCTFPSRVIKNYKPTGIVGSVFKLLGLARQLKNENIPPQESSIQRLVVGGESFAEESRAYLAEIWGCEVYNTYGSTEGTMCSECTDKSGLHVTKYCTS